MNSPTNKHLLSMSIAAAIVAVLASGCATVGIGTPAGSSVIAYKAGELVSTEPASIDKTWTATDKAFKDLQLLGEAKEKDGLAARMEATGAGDKRITVKLRNQGDKLTEVRIRVGLFGDEGYSRKILEKIKKRL